jgi:hypothetical protein
MSVNHHGSQHSTNENWLSALEPQVATISCGTTLGHPKQDVLDRLAAHQVDVYVTQQARSGIEKTTTVVGGKYVRLVSRDDGKTFALFDGDGQQRWYSSRGTKQSVFAANDDGEAPQTVSKPTESGALLSKAGRRRKHRLWLFVGIAVAGAAYAMF